MFQSANIEHGGYLASWKTASGQDYRIEGIDLPDNEPISVHLFRHRNPSVSIMDSGFQTTVSGGAITFKQNGIAQNLQDDFKAGDFIKPGYYIMRLRYDNDLKTLPIPDTNSLRMEVFDDELVFIEGATPILDEGGDPILDEAGDPILHEGPA